MCNNLAHENRLFLDVQCVRCYASSVMENICGNFLENDRLHSFLNLKMKQTKTPKKTGSSSV